MSKEHRFRAPMLIDIFIDDDSDTTLDDQKQLATIEANEIKKFLEDKGYNVQVQEIFFNPFGKIS